MKEKIPPHEADKLAVDIEKGFSMVKRFGTRGSFVIMMTAIFLLVSVLVYSFIYLRNNSGAKFTDIAGVLQGQDANAGLFGTNFNTLNQNRSSYGFGSYSTSGSSSGGTTSGYSQTPTVCPRGSTYVVPETLEVGQTANVYGPNGWRGGSFYSTNPSVVRVSGNTVTAIGAGYAQVYGIDFITDVAWPCSSDAVGVTVKAPPVKPAFISGYEWVGSCKLSAQLFATSPVPAEIRFQELRDENGVVPGFWKKTAALTKQSDGTYSGSITVNYSDFGGQQGVAAIFRLYDANSNLLADGYAAVSSVYDSQCN